MRSKSNNFLKLNCRLSQVRVTLTNDFDKKFVVAHYNYFLKTELNYDKENHVNFKFMNLTCVLIYCDCNRTQTHNSHTRTQNVFLNTVLKTAAFWKLRKIWSKISMTKFTVKKVATSSPEQFKKIALAPYDFAGNFHLILIGQVQKNLI